MTSWLRGRIEEGELTPSSADKIAVVWDLHIATSKIADLYIDDIPPRTFAWLDELRAKRYAPGKGAWDVGDRDVLGGVKRILAGADDDVVGAYCGAMNIVTRASIAVVALAGCWSSPRPPAPRRDIEISLAAEHFALANGWRVVVVPQAATSDVSVTVRYGVGSSQDPAGREGMAHLVEHAMFEHVRTAEPLFDFLVARALEHNGFTTADATIFTARAEVRSLGELLEVEAARLEQPCAAIPEEAFLRQREIVRNELRERESDTLVQAALHAGMFASGHPSSRYATVESVGAITHEQACAFVAQHYSPSNAVVVISGATSMRAVQPLVERTLGRIARRAHPARAIPPTATSSRSSVVDAPVDRRWFVLAWPLPDDPAGRSRARAIVGMSAAMVESRTNGLVTVLELGAGAARRIAIAISPSEDITASDALDSASNAIARMDPWFGTGFYEHAKHRALYRLATSFDRSTERDMVIAEDMAAGRDPRTASALAVRALLSMSRDDARKLLHAAYDPDHATIVTLRPSRRATRAGGSIAPSIHEERRVRREDPAEARRPAAAPALHVEVPPARTLRNGLRVVLFPRSGSSTVEIRLVFPTGSADETASQRGATAVAAAALSPPNEIDAFRFMQVGGVVEDRVEWDHTVFAVRGLGAHLDLLLAGLSSTIRDGDYTTEGLREVASLETMRSQADPVRDRATSAWRETLYGAGHPYTKAGRWREAGRDAFDIDAVRRLREQRFTPTGATLIVAGAFDPVIADRWIDYHLGEWSGAAPIRRTPRATFRPSALAQVVRGDQLSLELAFELRSGDLAARAVVAALVGAAIADIRQQLGASYGMHARLVQHRLSTTIELGGHVDAARAKEVGALLRDRLGRLRATSDETASLFVAARRTVVAQMGVVETAPATIADRATNRLARGLDPSASLPIERARTLTIDRIAPLLDGLELSRAAIFARGSEEALRDVFTALGRGPTLVP